MGSPSPAASKLKKESPIKVVTTTPHRRTSSVASSCISLESGDQDVQSLNGLPGKSPVSDSPRTPLERSGSSPAAMKKRRASIGSPDDLGPRNLDFGTSTSPSIEEKKHPFLTRGGGHKKVVIPATQTSSSPVKKGKSTTTPPGKEKQIVAGRATSVLSPRKLVEATKKDMISSPRRSILASEGPSMNGSINSEGTSSLVVEPKKASPLRASLDGKKSSPRPNVKSVASMKSRNDESGSSPLEGETKVSPGKILLRKSTSSLPSLKSKPGLTSPRTQKLAKTRQDTPSQPGRVKARIEKAVRNEEVSLEPVSVCSENGNETEANNTKENVAKMEVEDGSTLLPSLMEDGNVGDEDMGSLEQGGDPEGFDNDTEMPTSWLSEDLPCMFSSLDSHLPEPDDSSSCLLDDPPELLDEPEELISEPKNATVEPNNATVAAESIMPRSLEAKFVATDSYPSQISEWNSESSFFNQVESEAELERAHDDATSELESSTIFDNKTLIFPVPETESQSCETMVTTHFEEISSSLPVTESVASEALTENKLTEEQSSLPFVEGRSILPISSYEEPTEVVVPKSLQGGMFSGENVPPVYSHEEPTEAVVPKSLHGGDTQFIFSGENVPEVYISGGGALQEEERRPAAEEVASSDDEDLSCSPQLNLKQSFDDAAADMNCDDIALEEESPTTEQEITVTPLEFADETFTPTTHLDKDMMIFDFEEYWTQNVGDESSDAGQNDAEELQQVVTPVEEKGLELPVSSLPGEESIVLEPASFPQLDAQGWPCPASDNGQMDTNQEFDEVFHVFEGSDQLSLKEDLPEELSNQEPEPDSSVSPRYTTLETEHCNGVDIGQNLEDKDVEVVTEHQNVRVNTFPVQDESSVAAALPNAEPLAQAEDLDTPPIFLAVASNGLLGANIQRLVDNGASVESVDPEFAMQDASQNETPDADMAVYSDDSLDMGPENLEVCASSVKTADDRDAAELLPESFIALPVSEVAAGTEDSHDLISEEIGSSMVEGDESNILISGKEVESAISLPPVNGISEEEQTEALFLSSLDNKEEAKDSITDDHEFLSNLSEEEPQQDLAGGDQLMFVSKENSQFNMSSEDETEVPEHDNLQMLSEERPQEMQSQDDERVTTQMESHRDAANVDHQPPMPMISEPETLQDVDELPTGVLSVERSPVFDQEDEISNENFDSKSEAESTDEVDVGTDTVITAAGETINHTDTAEILQATPIILSAGELSNLTVDEFDNKLGSEEKWGDFNEVGEFDNKLGSEEKWGDFEEQSSKAVQEEADPSGSKSTTEDKKDLLIEELMVTNATIVTDERHGTTEDLEIDVDESEEATKTISTPVSTLDEIIDQESSLPFETPISTDDQEAALETEKDLVASSDAESDDQAIKDEEIVPDHFSSQDLPLVTSNQHTLNATISNVTEVSDLTLFKEGDNLNETLEQIQDEDTVVDSPFIHSTAKNMDADEKEENLILPCNLEEDEDSLKQEDEETVVCSPKNSFLASAQAETPDSTTHLNGTEGHSNISCSDDKEEESFNVHSPKDLNLGSNGIHTASWKDDSEEVSKPLHTDEDMSPKNFDTASLDVEEIEEHSGSVGKEEESLNGSLERDEDEDQEVKSQFNVEETPETAHSDVVNLPNNSWSDDKGEELLMEDEDTVVYRPTVEEVEKVDSHMEMFHMPEDKPTVENPGVEKAVDSHMEVFNVPDPDTTNAAIFDDVEEHKIRRDDDKSLNGSLEGKSKLEVEDYTMQSFVAPDLLHANLVVADELENQRFVAPDLLHSNLVVADELENQRFVAPDLLNANLVVADELENEDEKTLHQSPEEKSVSEVEDTVVESSKEQVVAPDLLNATITSNLVVADELENQSDKEEETLHQRPEAKLVEETVVESSQKSFVAPDHLLNANDTSNSVVEKQTETLEEKTIKESLVVSNEDNAGAKTLDAEDLDEHPTWKTTNKESLNGINLEEESMMLEAEDTAVDNVKQVSVQCLPEVNGATQSSSGTANSADKGALELHESSEAVHSTPEVNGAVQRSSGTANSADKDALEPHESSQAVHSTPEVNGPIQSSSGTANLADLEPHESSQAVHSTPEVNGAIQRSSGTANSADLESHESSQAVHSTEVEHSLDVPGVVYTDTADTKDCASDKPIDMTNGEKLKTDTAEAKDCASDKPIDMTNGEKFKNSNAPGDEKDLECSTTPTDTTDLEPQTPTEPQSPTATLYPLSQPPFSGSQQDRLWEEQAEAYNSGQGTPRNNATQAGAPYDSPSKVVPVESEDQIQPVTPANGNHAAENGGSSNGSAENGANTPTVQDEQQQQSVKERTVNGKEKLHTPLRSLLLEDAGGHGDTPNGVVTNSPSFIRRLFRVMSTSSRSSEREAKLKRSSSSMWVSCLGSPQVQQ